MKVTPVILVALALFSRHVIAAAQSPSWTWEQQRSTALMSYMISECWYFESPMDLQSRKNMRDTAAELGAFIGNDADIFDHVWVFTANVYNAAKKSRYDAECAQIVNQSMPNLELELGWKILGQYDTVKEYSEAIGIPCHGC